MRNALLGFALLFTSGAFSQIPSYDIYMAPLIKGDALGYRIGPILNISKHPGYDNQPSFSPDGKWIYFSSIRDSVQTDIYAANTSNWLIKQITNTPESEYSPEFFSDGKTFSTVRVEMDSTQRMWQFNADGSAAKVMMPDIDSMGYYCRINNDFYVFFMVTEPSTLVLVDVKNNTIDRKSVV